MIPDFIAEVQITYSSYVKASDRLQIKGSKSAADALRSIMPSLEHIEYTYMLLLNRAHFILGSHQLAKGGMCGTMMDPRVIFQVALKCAATSIVLAHNHPSGNLEPSDSDKKVTRQIKSAGEFLEINLVDHLILTADGFFSFADEGLI